MLFRALLAGQNFIIFYLVTWYKLLMLFSLLSFFLQLFRSQRSTGSVIHIFYKWHAGQLQLLFITVSEEHLVHKKVKARDEMADLGMFRSVPYKWGGFQGCRLISICTCHLHLPNSCLLDFSLISLINNSPENQAYLVNRAYPGTGLMLCIMFIYPIFSSFPKTELFPWFIIEAIRPLIKEFKSTSNCWLCYTNNQKIQKWEIWIVIIEWIIYILIRYQRTYIQ